VSGNDFKTQLLTVDGPDFINISSVDTEPLWVDRHRVEAIGVHGKGSLVVMQSGAQLVAKGTHPNELVQLVVEGNDDQGQS